MLFLGIIVHIEWLWVTQEAPKKYSTVKVRHRERVRYDFNVGDVENSKLTVQSILGNMVTQMAIDEPGNSV